RDTVFILRTIRAPKRKLRAGWFPYLSGALCHDDRGLYPVEYRWFKRGAVWPDTYRLRILFVSGGIYSRRYHFLSVRLQSFSPGDLRYLSYRGVCLADLLYYYLYSASRVF